jgi:hypothetical protein
MSVEQMFSQRSGIAILGTVIVIALIIGTVFGVAFVSRREITIATDIKQSAVAVAAADAGTEEALFTFWMGGSNACCLLTCTTNLTSCALTKQFQNGASYMVTYDFSSSGNRKIFSVGEFGSLRRAFELSGF